MNQATKPTSNHIAIVFDFDRTLIPDDSFYVLLKDCQIDKDYLVKDRINPLVDKGWENYLARTYCLVKESQKRTNNKITKDRLTKLGKKIELCKGVSTMFDRLRAKMNQIDSDIELEFYLMSGGFVDIARGTSIAKYFKNMWGCELQYNDQGEIEFMKRQMTHVEKTRYLYYISKGIDQENEKDLIYNYQDIPTEQIRIPLEQMIYIGDGTSDIPCFTLMNQHGGIALGVHSDERMGTQWEHRDKISHSQKLTNLVPANYEENSETMNSLFFGLEAIAKKINLSKLSMGE